MKICVTAESTIDCPKELLDEYGIKTVPFSVLLGEEQKLDGEIEPNEIFEYVFETKTLPKTSAVNEFQYAKFFSNIRKEYDAIIHFSLSSEFSSAYQNACNVAKRMDNVYIIDSRSLSTGIALLAIYATKLVKKIDDIEMILKLINSRIDKVQASFVLGRLDYLYKGGRCNSLQLLGSTLLNIKPQVVVQNGKMVVKKKFRGRTDDVVKKYVETTLEQFPNPDLEEVFITYTTACNKTIEDVKKVLMDYGFKNIHITHAGCTIASHCGEHCFGILYINDGKNEL